MADMAMEDEWHRRSFGVPAALTEVYGRRGGIKRPARKLINFGGVMLPRMEGQMILSPSRADSPDPKRELAAALELREQVTRRINYLQDLVREMPLEPKDGMVKIKVKFTPKGKVYEYLALKSPDQRWFTTGAQEEKKVFTNWTALAQWLAGDEVASYTIIELTEKVPF